MLAWLRLLLGCDCCLAATAAGLGYDCCLAIGLRLLLGLTSSCWSSVGLDRTIWARPRLGLGAVKAPHEARSSSIIITIVDVGRL